MEELKVGARMQLEVVESVNGCDGCFFEFTEDCSLLKCTIKERKDNKSVIFKLIEP